MIKPIITVCLAFGLLACTNQSSDSREQGSLLLVTNTDGDLSIYSKIEMKTGMLKKDTTGKYDKILTPIENPIGFTEAAPCSTYSVTDGDTGKTGCGLNCAGGNYPMSCDSDLILAWGIDDAMTTD